MGSICSHIAECEQEEQEAAYQARFEKVKAHQVRKLYEAVLEVTEAWDEGSLKRIAEAMEILSKWKLPS